MSSAILHDTFVSSSLHSLADSDLWVTIPSTSYVVEFDDAVLKRKFLLNAITIENSNVGAVKFKINDDNSIYVLDANKTENIDFIQISKITFLTTGKVRWKALSNCYNVY